MLALICKYPQAFIAYLIACTITGLLNFYPMEVKKNPVRWCTWSFMVQPNMLTLQQHFTGLPCHRLTAEEAAWFGDDV